MYAINSSQNLSVIFKREIDVHAAQWKLFALGANKKDTKSIWLIRESSIDGLLTATFFDQSQGMYIHNRFGFIEGDWVVAPKDKKEAELFAQKAKESFNNDAPEDSADKLFFLLNEYGFEPENQVRPNALEATTVKAYGGYTNFDSGSDDDEKTMMGYSNWN